ncbi:trigalactosyldiacylglycerol2 [Striga asiatica]|uniref:Trigalactosyldiacylglycerol2 n=1 Tax=Striga asiatica TaxID=4170 RepID=A0A5A7PGS6_STRAF|nr:trigalactosyldiacylglycerol2 [Striga asiatica]
MEGNSLRFVSTSPQLLPSYFPTPAMNGKLNFLPCLNTPVGQKMRKRIFVKATSSSGHNHQDGSSSESKSPLSLILDVPRTIWKQTLRPLSDFGFGRKSVWEGGVGLFLVSGAFLLAFSLAWLRGFQLRSRFNKYLAVFEFSNASGICAGTPVRIRGVNVGNVVRVNSSLKSIEAEVEIRDDKLIIPRNSLIEVNQSGLLMETLIDITPRDPIPSPSVGPLHANCVKESLIVCDRQKIKGHQGVSLDALVGIFTRIGREVEEIGVANAYSMAERVANIIEEARPLLSKVCSRCCHLLEWSSIVLDLILKCELTSVVIFTWTMAPVEGRQAHSIRFYYALLSSPVKLAYGYRDHSGVLAAKCYVSAFPNNVSVPMAIFRIRMQNENDYVFDVVIFQIQAMAEDIEPLLAEVQDSGLLKDVDSLTKSLTRASEEFRRVQSSIMTPENTELIQKSIYTLIFTLKNIENISSDILGFTGDEATRKNLKSLIKSLSRML